MDINNKNFPVWFESPINQKLKILFWDDLAETTQKNLFLEIKKGFEKIGWSAIITTRKDEALHIIATQKIDAVVLDLLEDGKPVGLEILKEIRHKKPFLPVIIFTVATEMEYVQIAMRGEVSYYLTKPIKGYTDIIRSVEVAIEREKAKEKLINDRYYAFIGALAASVSHYIKNSLWNIGSRAQFLLEKTDLNEESYNLLETIKRRCIDANKIILQLLNFAKRQKVQTSISEVNVIENLNDVLELLSYELKNNNISVEKKYNYESSYLKGNEFYLKEAFLNLIKNAIQAMPNGGKITIEAISEEKSLKINISDTGVGMEKKTLENLFIPFFTTQPKAIGFGLYETQRIINDHGGQIKFESYPQKGTKVLLEFPQNYN